ncbi:MAG: NAD(P)-binding protein [Oscillospiraceae bacterium]|nr:NAD(P)-binding protein [Oscillospiraceae bacterium]
MGKQIIVAGAGHGGLAAAALLARRGFQVTVYERNPEGQLGYDWTDIFAPGALKAAGIPMPPREQYSYKENMTFYSTNQAVPLRQHVPEDQLEIKMERHDLYSLLVHNACASGVRFVYECNIEAPILVGNRVIGIKTDKGEFFADLIIDAAGIDSPVRSGLPKMCGIENDPGENGRFYVYRAFYNRASEEMPEERYKVYLFPEEREGMAWVAAEGEYTDVLIGRFAPFDSAEVERHLAFLRKSNPALGTEIVRGGQFVQIPVRQPLAVMVCDGYAAIGDSAFMTVPIIGSGIANAFKAARMLVNTVLNDEDGEFSAEKLWGYQLDFFRHIGSDLAVLTCVKRLLMKIMPQELDYMFEKGILTADEFTIGANTLSLSAFIRIPPVDLIGRVKMLTDDKTLLKKLIPAVFAIGRLKTIAATIPKKWSRQRVILWSRRYLDVFQGNITLMLSV